MKLTFLLTAALFGQSEAPVDARQFERLIRASHSWVEDISFVVEGWSHVVRGAWTPGAPEAFEDPEAHPVMYQGLYAYRRDGATLYDVFANRNLPDGIHETRQTRAILDHVYQGVTRRAEGRGERPESAHGMPSRLNTENSPKRIVLYWLFDHLLSRPADQWGYQFQGWETVDGHRCLRVQVDFDIVSEERPPDRNVFRLWIDLERGGHPLRVEYGQGDEVALRTSGIALAKLRTEEAGEVWFPVAGRTETFAYLGGYSRRPLHVEDYRILDDTVRFNQGLPDSVFTVDYAGGLAESPELAERRSTFRQPLPRSDPAGITERIGRRLEEVDARAEVVDSMRRIEAPSPARRSWSGTAIAQAALIGFGVATIAAVGIWRWRSAR